METVRECQKLVEHLRRERSRREAQWRLLSRWICPWRGRFDNFVTDMLEKDAPTRFTHLASQAVLSGASGMTSGMTPRNVSWFKPSFSDPALMEASGARGWLDVVDSRMKDCLAEGGFYQAIQNFNLDLLWAGCALLYTETGSDSILSFECCQVGTYLLQTNSGGKLEAVARRLVFSMEEAINLFGEKRLSKKALARAKRNPLEQLAVWHLVKPERPENIKHENQFPVISGYWEEGNRESFLRESGYYEMPFFFARWNDGATSYGTGPGDMCLADARQIDMLEHYKLSGLGKLVDPPVSAPHSLKETLDLGPGGINFTTERDLIRPLLDLSPYAQAMTAVANEILTVSQRLNQGLMSSIFASMPLEQRPAGMSATEFLERKREALQQLGPVMSAYEPLVLSPLLFRVARALERERITPPPPESLAKIEKLFMKMDFISPMANALRQSGAETTRAIFQDVAMMYAQTRKEELFDKVDLDQMVDELASGIGCPGSIIRSDADVARMRKARAQAQMQAQMQASGATPNVPQGTAAQEEAGDSLAGLAELEEG